MQDLRFGRRAKPDRALICGICSSYIGRLLRRRRANSFERVRSGDHVLDLNDFSLPCSSLSFFSSARGVFVEGYEPVRPRAERCDHDLAQPLRDKVRPGAGPPGEAVGRARVSWQFVFFPLRCIRSAGNSINNNNSSVQALCDRCRWIR